MGACVASGGQLGLGQGRVARLCIINGDPNVLVEVTNGALNGGGGKRAPQARQKSGLWAPGLQLTDGDRIG